MRTPLVAGNWKMHMTIPGARQLVEETKAALDGVTGVEVVFCPPATALWSVGKALAGTPWELGGQTMYWESKGAFTGEISAEMLVDAGCRYVILGHSERRTLFGETSEAVGRKVQAAFDHGLIPIVCVGEQLAERQDGRTDTLITQQVSAAVPELTAERAAGLVVAYEPVWAIGTGHTATSEEANRVSGLIRRVLAKGGDAGAASAVRILYGGSVKPDNIREFVDQPDIDGALVGGASLDARAFATIVRVAAKTAA